MVYISHQLHLSKGYLRNKAIKTISHYWTYKLQDFIPTGYVWFQNIKYPPDYDYFQYLDWFQLEPDFNAKLKQYRDKYGSIQIIDNPHLTNHVAVCVIHPAIRRINKRLKNRSL